MHSAGRSFLDVLNTPSYISLIEGKPGSGKTTITLAACAQKGSCTYISYSEPEASIIKKVKLVDPDFKGKLSVVSMMTGNPAKVYSIISDALSNGEIVAVDSLDAMFYGIKGDQEIRPFLQLIYGTAKVKPGSLVLISEGLNPASNQVRFVADAIISVDYEDILGCKARRVTTAKDRDFYIGNPYSYFTMGKRLVIMRPLDKQNLQYPSKVELLPRPPEAMPEYELNVTINVVTEVKRTVDFSIYSLYKLWVAADLLLRGYPVNYVISPFESVDGVTKTLEKMTGGSIKRLNVLKFDPHGLEKDVRSYIKMASDSYSSLRARAFTIVDLLSYEDLAVRNPAIYEQFLKEVTEMDSKNGISALLYGYEGFETIRMEKKYAASIREMDFRNGTLFWRSITPQGSLFALEFAFHEGKVNQWEMV